MLRLAGSLAFLAVALAVAPHAAGAEDFPSRPVRLVIGAPPGAGADALVRAIADDLHAEWGQPIVVDNRPGADGVIAARTVAAAAPDGHTVLVVLRSQVIAPILNPNAGFDLLRDFEPVMLVAHQRLALVIAPSLPVTSVRGLVQLSRATPGTLDYGSANASFQLSTEALLRHTGARMHRIPYGGSPQVLRALMVGEVQVALLNASILGEAVRDGRVRALAVIAPARSPDLPDVPTLAEAGYPGFDLPFWVGVAVPARTPEPIVAALNRAITRAMARPSARARIAATGYEPDPDTPAAFGARLARESAESAEILRGIDPTSR